MTRIKLKNTKPLSPWNVLYSFFSPLLILMFPYRYFSLQQESSLSISTPCRNNISQALEIEEDPNEEKKEKGGGGKRLSLQFAFGRIIKYWRASPRFPMDIWEWHCDSLCWSRRRSKARERKREEGMSQKETLIMQPSISEFSLNFKLVISSLYRDTYLQFQFKSS